MHPANHFHSLFCLFLSLSAPACYFFFYRLKALFIWFVQHLAQLIPFLREELLKAETVKKKKIQLSQLLQTDVGNTRTKKIPLTRLTPLYICVHDFFINALNLEITNELKIV